MDWVTPVTHASGVHVHDVLILGAGQGGLATAFGLLREKVTNILVLDRAEPGREGPWITYARMLTFRSPKHVTGPDLGVPALTPQAWFQAVFGPAGWEAITKWPRALWQDYLVWYRAALDLPVRNRTEITAIAPEDDLLRVSATDTASGERLTFLARKIVLATGIEGNGDWRLPALALDRLPKDRFAHTNWEFDVGALRGKRVGVLGAGASAFDTAASALEAGAASVHQFARRPALPLKDPYRTMEKSGFLRHFGSMTALERWRWLVATRDQGVPATQDGIDRCTVFPNYRITTGAGWAKVAFADGDVIVTGTDGAEHRFDFLVLGTGYADDGSGAFGSAPRHRGVARALRAAGRRWRRGARYAMARRRPLFHREGAGHRAVGHEHPQFHRRRPGQHRLVGHRPHLAQICRAAARRWPHPLLLACPGGAGAGGHPRLCRHRPRSRPAGPASGAGGGTAFTPLTIQGDRQWVTRSCGRARRMWNASGCTKVSNTAIGW